MKENVLLTKAAAFAIRIVKLSRYLSKEQDEFVISKQLIRCGTSIGANAKEAQFAESKKDFIHKLTISLKEANETKYWLDLIYKTGFITEKMFLSIKHDCDELLKLLVSIVKTSKAAIK